MFDNCTSRCLHLVRHFLLMKYGVWCHTFNVSVGLLLPCLYTQTFLTLDADTCIQMTYHLTQLKFTFAIIIWNGCESYTDSVIKLIVFFFKLRERVTLFSSCNSLQGYLIKPCFSHGLLTLSYHIKDFDKFSLNVILKRSHCLTESPISIGKRIPELQSKISIIKHLRVIICIQVITPFLKLFHLLYKLTDSV